MSKELYFFRIFFAFQIIYKESVTKQLITEI